MCPQHNHKLTLCLCKAFQAKLCCSETRVHRTIMGKWGLPASDRGNTALALFSCTANKSGFTCCFLERSLKCLGNQKAALNLLWGLPGSWATTSACPQKDVKCWCTDPVHATHFCILQLRQNSIFTSAESWDLCKKATKWSYVVLTFLRTSDTDIAIF